MKTIIINASPRKNGNIKKMLDTIITNIRDDADFDVINISNANIKPCIGCMRCRSLNKCILPYDDAHEIGEAIEKADNIIIGSPTYWGNMPGILKMLFDRNVYRFMDESKSGIPIKKMNGKNGYIVSTCTTPFPFNIIFKQSSGTIHAINEVFKYSGIKLKDTIVLSGTKTKKEIPESKTKKLKKLALKL